MIDLLFLILGFVVLFISGKYLVVGGVQLARFFKLPTLVVGLTVVSLGTSAPELLVSLKAALSGHPDISVGNVVGSNISNIGLVLGITAIICPIPVIRKLLGFDWPYLMAVSILVFLLSYNGILSNFEGIIFILIIVFFNVFSILKGRQQSDENIEPVTIPWYYATLIILGSCVGLVFGAEWLVEGATGLARNFGVSERIISVSIIAFGTSVPELATSIVAALRRETDISIGNIIGSNLFNLAGILGVTAIVTPIPVNLQIVNSDMLWMIGITLLLFVLMIVGKSKKISRVNGLILIASYCSYIYFLLS